MPAQSKTCRSTCPIASTLDLVGDKWSLILLRDLLFRNLHEFGEFLQSPEGIATNILSARLNTLTEDGIISSIPHPTNRTKKLYYLTEKGKSLIAILIEFTVWGSDQVPGTQAPPPVIDAMRNQREEFTKLTLEILAAWEADYLTTQ